MNLVLLGVYFAMVILSSVMSRPANDDEILEYVNHIRSDGYDFRYETASGVVRSERGQLKPNQDALQVIGSYKYKLPNGKILLVSFQADENGYRPKTEIISLPIIQYLPPAAYISLAGGGGVG